MDQSLYIQIKQILSGYNYASGNFYGLFKYAKKAGLSGLSFKQFCEHARNMGVSSKVSRIDGQLLRVLSYDPKADQYLKNVFPIYDTCAKCKGLGVVEIKLRAKKY